MQECEGQIQQEGVINWLHAKLEQRSALELNECHLTAGPEMAECLFKLCVKTYYITQAHINTFALAGGQVLGTHTQMHTTIIIISCAETDRKMHVVIQFG